MRLGKCHQTYLVIPSVRACSHLNAPFKSVTSTQEIAAQLCQVVWLGIIQTDHEQGGFDHGQTRGVVLVRLDQGVPEPRPDLSRLRGQNAQSVRSHLVHRGLVGVLDDRFEGGEDLFVAEDRPVLRVKAIEPIYG